MKRSELSLFLRGALSILLLLFFTGCASRKGTLSSSTALKEGREMRAAWWPTVWRNDYKEKNTTELKQLLTQRLDKLHQIGINAVVFQVRSEADAFYASRYEPWSRFLTGVQGASPEGLFDPLPFIIEECHKRGMEFHAWINPFRASVKTTNPTAPEHISHRYPNWIIPYNGQSYLDPGLPEVRSYVCRVAQDIVLRYDIDALHIDDYFYPYPVTGIPFNDNYSFEKYGLSKGYSWSTKADWRRENINHFIAQLRETLQQTKPWVALGISPFGIYRNNKNWAGGSKTTGLEGYEALYADVILWAKKGWIDYLTPQIYWNYGHTSADYQVLLDWWGAQKLGETALYIGQDIRRSMDGQQLTTKINHQRKVARGDFFWPADDLWSNYGGIIPQLNRLYAGHRVATPVRQEFRGTTSKKITNLRFSLGVSSSPLLEWEDTYQEGDPLSPRFYLVYALPNGKKSDFPHKAKLLSISSDPFYLIPLSPYYKGFAVTALNHFGVESKPAFLF
ncbi:glycoside hydrolase family 10 protein [Porphyromonas circumdentaria]|uniref:Uncharacterized lipoprotein YddW, UPF0748 family n=1 Tax=Porphyromonas circumdentaria TaxID=29524 RepID=A0A1T4PPF1_9PORP|nr:family 10 glycosylhydrolase [Porphyromonas circumdentaria]MBB6276446.1 uncharacterized lipoprotein YddW (UPF0748 family) [Porphyromonas circumdentaria]MDO4723120.1 family 10 glycosylhydrolase [Porphyromonas circumdentaria]SJZ93464.1 Uncharacterized lipoprotein YddW, UPF0748 family [Porphyromonas circumdentaria]